MKVLIVCSFNSGKINSFITEQVESLNVMGVEFNFFKIKGQGIRGYLKNLPSLRKEIQKGDYDLIHAHYGFSGLLANLQRKIPVITTYHGSDVHFLFNRVISFFTSRLSVHNILTHSIQVKQLALKDSYSVIPCGINTGLFFPRDKQKCRSEMGFKEDENIVLFSSSFDREVKNPSLAKEAISLLEGVRLIELKGYSREEVVKLINAADVMLITSQYETGPLVAKEALACNTPVISTDVGDVKSLIDNLDNCFICKEKPHEIAAKIKKSITTNHSLNSENEMQIYKLSHVASRILKVYKKVIQ